MPAYRGSVVAAIASLAGSAWAADTPQSIKLGSYQGAQTTVQASVAGHDGTFLFDTGGGITIISPALAEAAGCTPWGNITGFRMRGDRLDVPRCDNIGVAIDGGHFIAPIASVFDLAKISPKDAPHDGLIALDVFAGKAVTFEPAAGKLTVETPGSLASRAAHMTAVPVRLVRDSQGVALTVDIGVPTPKGMAWMEIDSGSDDTAVDVSKAIAPLLGIDPANPKRQPIHVVLAPGLVLQGTARPIDGLIMDGNIPIHYLKDWIITLDLANGRAWVAPLG
jgi:hypothetical protein